LSIFAIRLVVTGVIPVSRTDLLTFAIGSGSTFPADLNDFLLETLLAVGIFDLLDGTEELVLTSFKGVRLEVLHGVFAKLFTTAFDLPD
jgi:hypothetical protein